MGIPSVRREVHSYLTDTLHSLISELSPQEKEDSVIVVLIAETDPQYTAVVTENIKALFPTEIHSGLLEVIAPSPHFYPDFSRLRESFGDPKERVRWRTKQNLDYCFLMMYAQSKGIYYVQVSTALRGAPRPGGLGVHAALPGAVLSPRPLLPSRSSWRTTLWPSPTT